MGGTEPRGALFAPTDALEGDDPVVLRYVRQFLEREVVLTETGTYELGSVKFATPVRHRHRGTTFGFRFQTDRISVSYVADTAYFQELADHYRADVIILNVVRHKPSDLDHLHLPEAQELIAVLKPRLAVLTHFGMTMLRAKPWRLAREVSQQTGVEVIAATDGRRIDLTAYGQAR